MKGAMAMTDERDRETECSVIKSREREREVFPRACALI